MTFEVRRHPRLNTPLSFTSWGVTRGVLTVWGTVLVGKGIGDGTGSPGNGPAVHAGSRTSLFGPFVRVTILGCHNYVSTTVSRGPSSSVSRTSSGPSDKPSSRRHGSLSRRAGR